LVIDLFQRLNFEQSFLKPFFKELLSAKFYKNNLSKVSGRRARDRDRNSSRPRRNLRPSRLRPRLQKTGLETRLETETKSRASVTGNHLSSCHPRSFFSLNICMHLYEDFLCHAYGNQSLCKPCKKSIQFQRSCRFHPNIPSTNW